LEPKWYSVWFSYNICMPSTIGWRIKIKYI